MLELQMAVGPTTGEDTATVRLFMGHLVKCFIDVETSQVLYRGQRVSSSGGLLILLC